MEIDWIFVRFAFGLLLTVALSYIAGYFRGKSREAHSRALEAKADAEEMLKHVDALEALINQGEEMGRRFIDPQLSFTNYIKKDPKNPMPRMLPAAKITEGLVEHVQKRWGLPDTKPGMYLLLHANGNGELMSSERFEEMYELAHTTY